jgi:outer membrane autotransporter protein
MGKNSLLMIDGNKVSGSQAAAITDVSTTDISPSAKIYISNAKGNATYNILSGTNDKDGNGLFAEARAAVNSNVFSYGHLLEFVGAEGNGETQFSVTAESQDAHDVYGDKVIAPNTINAAMDSGGAASAFALAASDDNLTEEAQESAFNSASALTELAGVQHGLYAANNLFDSSLTSHLTGLYTEDQDKDLWAHFIHSKENVRGLGLANMGASYDAQFNGVVVCSDFYKKGNATVGAALTYMDGSFSGNTEAAHTKNDVDYYGLALYGRVEQGPMTYLGDISYLHESNDLKQHNSGSTITGSTDSDAYSIGVRAERGIGLGMGTLTPFAGLRYAHLGTDAYTDSIGVRHDSDDANVWMFPLGLRYSADIKNGTWTIRPMAEASYVWTFGDRDGTDKVSLGGASDAFGFDIADAGSWYGRLGVQAAKGNFTYGVAYQYQHGASVQSNTWTAAVRYHF